MINAPESWTAKAVAELVSGAGGDEVSVEPCTTHDLIDQPTRWLNAAQDVVADPGLRVRIKVSEGLLKARIVVTGVRRTTIGVPVLREEHGPVDR